MKSARLSRREVLASAAGAVPLLSLGTHGGDWRAGAARADITPEGRLWQAGYAARTHASQGAIHRLWARCLALEDGSGRAAALVGTDLLGLPAEVSARIARECRARYGLSRDRLILNATHTHGGPVVGNTLRVAYGMTDTEWSDVARYTAWMERRVVEAVGLALGALQPARLRFGRTRATFGTNRRTAINPNGPKDDDVPVLRVDSAQGRPLAIAFGYACHCTTLGGDCYEFHGDFAGFAQDRLEAEYPGAVALFITGCAGDINPAPRGTVDLAFRHGSALAAAVGSAVEGSLLAVSGPLGSRYHIEPLAFAEVPGADYWRARLTDANVFEQRRARLLLARIEREGTLPQAYPSPVQAWRFGRDLVFIALSGEVVVDFALRLRREIPGVPVWVSAYNNDVFAYVPSLRVLREGGYEGEGAMLYYGLPSRFAEDVEERVVAAARRAAMV